jgi:hypothetical protein
MRVYDDDDPGARERLGGTFARAKLKDIGSMY